MVTSVARILQWGLFEHDVTFDHTLYTGADSESLGGRGGGNFELG